MLVIWFLTHHEQTDVMSVSTYQWHSTHSPLNDLTLINTKHVRVFPTSVKLSYLSFSTVISKEQSEREFIDLSLQHANDTV